MFRAIHLPIKDAFHGAEWSSRNKISTVKEPERQLAGSTEPITGPYPELLD